MISVLKLNYFNNKIQNLFLVLKNNLKYLLKLKLNNTDPYIL